MRTDRCSLGLASVSFRDRSPREILTAARSAGLTCIEWGSDVHAPPRDPARLSELAALGREMGIACSSYGTYFRLGETSLSELFDYIAAARLLGTDVLRLWCGSKSGADLTEDEWAGLLAECRRAARIAEAEGVRLCMECHMRTVTERSADAVRLMEEVASPAFRTYWQPFQWQSAEENLENARMLAPYTEHIHVFHWKGSARLPLADAIPEWRAYLEAFKPPRTLLLEFMPDDRIESLPAEADALRRIAGGSL